MRLVLAALLVSALLPACSSKGTAPIAPVVPPSQFKVDPGLLAPGQAPANPQPANGAAGR